MSPRSPQLIIVIPCHDEPDLLNTLRSLWLCQRPYNETTVVIVINHGQNDDHRVKRQNQDTLDVAQSWIQNHPDPYLTFFSNMN